MVPAQSTPARACGSASVIQPEPCARIGRALNELGSIYHYMCMRAFYAVLRMAHKLSSVDLTQIPNTRTYTYTHTNLHAPTCSVACACRHWRSLLFVMAAIGSCSQQQGCKRRRASFTLHKTFQSYTSFHCTCVRHIISSI